MSKDHECMQQVTEIAGIGINRLDHFIRSARHLLQYSIIFGLIATAACNYQSSDRDASGNGVRILRRGLLGEPRTLDPQLADDNYSLQVVRDLYEGLTAEDPDGQVVPGVANSWTVDSTGTIYIFQIRPDAKWSNGDRTVAAEFVQGMRRAVDPKTASGSAALLAVIKGASEIIAGRKNVAELGVTAIGDTSIRVELEHPAPYVLQILSQPIAAPVHVSAQSISQSDHSMGTFGIYNGAYTLVNRVPGSLIELERNPNYWGSSKVSIERVQYINAESEATELKEYIAGQLDMSFTIPMPDISRVMQQYRAEVQIAPILGSIYLALNLSNPPLNDSTELRQALSMAIDREQIAEHVMMGVTPAYAFVADGVRGYVAPRYDWAEWTREQQLSVARSLYAKAGYSEKNPLHLRLYFNSDESIQRIMLATASSWKQNLGVISELSSEEFQVFLAGRMDRGRWDVTRLGWDADYDDPSSFLDIFSQGNTQNDPSYKSIPFNQLIDQARHEPESGKRMVLLHNAEEILLNDYPIIPIYFRRARRLVKPYVGGAQITPMNRTYTKNLYWKRVS